MSYQDWIAALEKAEDAKELVGQAMGAHGLAEAKLGGTVVRCNLHTTHQKTLHLHNEVAHLMEEIEEDIAALKEVMKED